jgi:hypothetical protein
MYRQGMKVAALTKKAGQVPRTGTVIGVRRHDVEVRWEDGHSSVISRRALTAVHNKQG